MASSQSESRTQTIRFIVKRRPILLPYNLLYCSYSFHLISLCYFASGWILLTVHHCIILVLYNDTTVGCNLLILVGCSLRDLGLERYDTVELFARILLPAAFLLACILQLHYFNDDFLSLTDLHDVPKRQISRSGVCVFVCMLYVSGACVCVCFWGVCLCVCVRDCMCVGVLSLHTQTHPHVLCSVCVCGCL